MRTAFLAAVAALAAQGGAAGQRDASCAIQNEIVRLVVQSEHFLSHLASGEYPEAPKDLEERLRSTSVLSLRTRLEEGGLADSADPAERMVLQQRLLLRANRVEGRARASASAADIGAMGTLTQLRNQAAAWPCFDSSRAFAGLSIGAGVEGAPGSAEKVQSALFVFICLLVVGGGTYFWWRGNVDKRRTRRYSCWIPCTLAQSTGLHPVAIVDISRSGARIRTDTGHTAGEEVLLKFSDAEVAARVVRASRRYCAVHFTGQLSAAFVQEALDTYG